MTSAIFSEDQRTALLAVEGVGPAVIARLEELGISSFHQLATRNAEDICAETSARLGSTCWKNSPQARAAINAAIERAKAGN
ncbi:helix-hairpin-helix domain-containing protein [Altererythrobacter indicus]|uniref:Helix-hairpin-helix domain-containing protein n=1 Tax=Altericroceibacterium indicum TaxID=374177 RepID=A0A845A678_9SPHN|nr:helix-hairpin-helix domain-containing protein [Altericroceibacterium indicum]MXP25194.1 helix-hairpin-helix domain-containing protein [Altericroceibacterium indicum]